MNIYQERHDALLKLRELPEMQDILTSPALHILDFVEGQPEKAIMVRAGDFSCVIAFHPWTGVYVLDIMHNGDQLLFETICGAHINAMELVDQEIEWLKDMG